MQQSGTGVAFCFPGQGSQRGGMAGSLFDDPLFAELLEIAEAGGVELESALRGDDDGLRPTQVAQPALYLMETVLATRLAAQVEVSAVAGHSVGEYAAATAAGALTPREGMQLVMERGKLMAAMTEGTMAAVIGLETEQVEAVCLETSGTGATVVVANDNAPGQVVISGSPDGVEAATQRLRDAGAKRVVQLAVSGAFHSPLMQPAAETFALRLAAAEWNEPNVPVVTNVDAEPTSTVAELRERMVAQLSSPVRWRQSMQTLADLGVNTFIEVGPGNVLTGLIKRSLSDVTVMGISKIDDIALVTEKLGAMIHG